MWPLVRSPQRISRYREIAGTLARHGLGWLVLELGLGNLLPFHKGLLGHSRREMPYSRPEHFRMALEDLGVEAAVVYLALPLNACSKSLRFWRRRMIR